MADWRDPGKGYNTFEGSAPDLWSAYLAYHKLVTTADTARMIVATAWKAQGADALRDTLLAFTAPLGDIQETLTTARSALITYNSELGAAVSAAYYWQGQYQNLNWKLNQPDRMIWDDPVGAADDALERVRNLADFVEAKNALKRIFNTRREADARVIAALRASVPASWADQSAAFTAAGITQSILLDSSQSKQAMLDLAKRMLDGNGDYSDETVGALSGLLSVWGGDQTTMSRFFSSLGGANTAELIDRLGEEMSMTAGAYGELADGDQAILTLANRLRSGLSLGSQDWGQDFANGYMEDMFTGNPEYWARRDLDSGVDPSSYSARTQAISFLFSDPLGAPMSEAVTIAAAEIVDHIERELGTTNLVNWVNPEAGVGAGVFGFYTADGVYTGEMSQMDLSGRVLETLGFYPDAALDFVSGEGRIEYWFTERSWAYGDGFAGPGGLWLGVANADGPESASAVSEIMFALALNDEFNSDNISAAGSARLASALSVDLATVTEFALMPPEDYDGKPGHGSVTMFGDGSDTDAPTVTPNVLAAMLGAAGSQDLGAYILNQTSLEIQQGYIEYGMMTSPENFQEALRQSNTLQGFIDGSGIGERLAAAERSDTRREELVEGISTLVGIIPLPAVGDVIVHGGSFVIDLAQNALVEFGNQSLSGLAMGGPVDYNAALISTGVTEETLKDSRMYANGVAVWNYLQTEGAAERLAEAGIDPADIPKPEGRQTFETEAHYLERSNDWYLNNVDDLNEAAQAAFGDDNFYLKNVLGAYGAHEGDGESEVIK